MQWPRSGIFIVGFEHISHLVPLFQLLILNMYLAAGMDLSLRNASRAKLETKKWSQMYV